MPPRVVTFGEGLVRLSPARGGRLEQASALDVWPGGAELNVAIGLARLGTESAWVSRLPHNPLGRLVASHARTHGVDTAHVRWSDDGRVGLYFLELASRPRSSAVLYDRAGSAFARLDPDELDWPAILAGAAGFHVSGITSAVSANAAAAAADGLRAARAAGVHTSYDVNLRRRLVEPERACRHCEGVADSVDTLFCSLEDATAVFGTEDAAEVRDRLEVPTVVLSAPGRFRTAVGETAELVETVAYEPLDPIGAGDAFCAGFLHARLAGARLREALELGDAVAAVKLTIPGDAPLVDLADVEAVLGRVPAGVSR